MNQITVNDPFNSTNPIDTLQVYNGLDCCITLEVLNALLPQAKGNVLKTYSFSRSLSAPILEMNMRGVLIDRVARGQFLANLRKSMARLNHIIDTFAIARGGFPLNPNSPKQLKEFFFNVMRLPRSKAMNREALEKLLIYSSARPIISAILTYRALAKQYSTIDVYLPDSRFYTSYNIAGTDTGRLSSSTNLHGAGGNIQNQTEAVRHLFISDPGMKLAYFDLAQAESRGVGFLSWLATGDDVYLNACESSDLHTEVAKMVWPELNWGAGNDHTIAKTIYYRHFTYRDMAKRGGHGTNYFGSAYHMAAALKIPTTTMQDFQDKYFDAFQGIKKWHHEVARELQLTNTLTTPFNRTRQFFGLRPGAIDKTLKKAIAFLPQSWIADILNTGLLSIWKANLPIHLILQIHDAVGFLYHEKDEDWILDAVHEKMAVTTVINKRTFTIPIEQTIGWNWGKYSTVNPDGLKLRTGRDERKRQTRTDIPLLHRSV